MRTTWNTIFLRFLTILVCVVAPIFGQTNPSLSTQFAPLQSSTQGHVFNIEAIKDVVIRSFDMETGNFGFPNDLVEVWTTIDGGSYVGRESDKEAWKLVGTADMKALVASGIPGLALMSWTPLQLDLGVLVKAGTTRGFCIVSTDVGSFHGFATPTVNSIHAMNGDLRLRGGRRSPNFQAGSFRMMVTRVHYSLFGPFMHDIKPTKVLAPAPDRLSCDSLSPSENLTVEFINQGSVTIPAGAAIPVWYTLNGHLTVNEIASPTTSVPQDGTFTYTFSAPLDLSALRTHTVKVGHSYSLDQYSPNNEIEQEIHSGGELRVTSFPWLEDFGRGDFGRRLIPPLGWTHEWGDPLGFASEWEFRNTDLGAQSSTRPDFDHSTGVEDDGYYAHTNDEGSQGVVSLRSPCFDLGNMLNPTLRFWIYADNQNGVGNTLHLDLLDSSTGTVIPDITPPVGHVGATWTEQIVDLTPYLGMTFRLIFRASTDHFGNPNSPDDHEFAIDDVAIFDDISTDGQPPQAGFATFEVGENTLNGNALTIASQANGPYFASAQPGDLATFRFSGEPNQPVLILAGPLNPLAATFPVLGSMDIGGPVDPLTGIPTGLSIVADGNFPVGINAFFNTGASGEGVFGVSVPNLPPGLLTTFQCVIRTSGANGMPIALSNAVAFTVDL